MMCATAENRTTRNGGQRPRWANTPGKSGLFDAFNGLRWLFFAIELADSARILLTMGWDYVIIRLEGGRSVCVK